MANGVGLQDRTALITGVSGGIGLELTRCRDGYHLVMVGRDRERLEDVVAQLQSDHKIAVRCEPRDLSEPRAAFQLCLELRNAPVSEKYAPKIKSDFTSCNARPMSALLHGAGSRSKPARCRIK